MFKLGLLLSAAAGSADAGPMPPLESSPGDRLSWRSRLALAAIVLAVAWFYHWTINPEGRIAPLNPHGQDVYNLMVRGWLKGTLALDAPVDPALATLKNPYDPVERAGRGLHDASYYRGRYYIYFGATPALLLHLPVQILTGRFVAEPYAAWFFACAGWLVAVWLWRDLVRAHAAWPRWVFWAALPAIGLGNLVPAMLRRPAMWEVPIACAHALFMLVLVAVWRALRPGAGRGWLVAASVAMGLAIAARPVYLFCAVVLLVPLAAAAVARGRGFWREREWRLRVAAIFGPILAIGVLVAAYNYARFDHPLEFGQRYQMAGGDDNTKQTLFSPRFMSYHLRLYLLAGPGLAPYFPFLTIANPPPPPPGQIGMENPQGLLFAAPWVLLGLAGLAVWRRDPRLGWWSAGAGLAAGAALATLSGFAGAANRYEVDFAPALVLLGAVGAGVLAASPRGRWAAPVLVPVLVLWSVTANVLISIQHNRLLELNHPAEFARVAGWFNRVPAWYDRLAGTAYGPVELRLRFPSGAIGEVEPLVATGRQFLSDYVYAHYLPDNQVRFGFEHTAYGGGVGPVLRYDPAAEQVVTIQMGSLYPPAAYPTWQGVPPEVQEARRRLVQVTLNGRTALYLHSDCFTPFSREPSIGRVGPDRPAFKRDFSGEILGVRRLPPLAGDPLLSRAGALRLFVQLAAFGGRVSDPLVCSGRTGAGDLIYLIREAPDSIRIGHDHWGEGAAVSQPVTIDPLAPLDLEIDSPVLRPGETAELVVKVNGRDALRLPRHFHAAAPGELFVGRNPIGASTAGPELGGRIVLAERL